VLSESALRRCEELREEWQQIPQFLESDDD
jgi:hypothetical protein